MTPVTLYRNGRIFSPADPTATALLVRDGHIDWLGPDADAPVSGVDATIDVSGALLTPAFVDAHVHTTSTGVSLLGLDLSGCASATEVLDQVSAFADT
jgi:predicted amidohydrolase YtcJ